jgi:DnaJ homolog subfamily B member 4
MSQHAPILAPFVIFFSYSYATALDTMTDGTKITFEREGDEERGIIPADIIFTLQTRPHDRFQRDGDDLIYKCPVSLVDALTGVRATVKSLDNRDIQITCPSVTPQTVKVITGEGMPNLKKRTRGDLRVVFEIQFPDMDASQRAGIAQILGGRR